MDATGKVTPNYYSQCSAFWIPFDPRYWGLKGPVTQVWLAETGTAGLSCDLTSVPTATYGTGTLIFY